MSALGSLVVKLALEHAEFTKGLDKSSQEALRFAKNTQDAVDKAQASIKSMAASAVGLTAGLVGVSSASTFLANSLSFADKINDISKANELAVSSVLNFSHALSLNGGEAENSQKIFASFSATVESAASGSEEARAKFQRLGLSLNDIAKLDQQSLFDKTIQGLSGIKDPLERNALAADFLGKAVKGVDINGLADDYTNNAQDFQDAEKAFRDIGDAMDNLDRFSQKASTKLAEHFGPVLKSITEKLDMAIFGFDSLEEKINKRNSQGGKVTWKPGITINDDISGLVTGNVRNVVDKDAEQKEKKRQKDAESSAKAAASAIEAQRKAYDGLVGSLNSKIQLQQLELSVNEPLSEQQKLAIEINEKVASGQLKLNATQKAHVEGLIQKLGFVERDIELAALRKQSEEAYATTLANTLELQAQETQQLLDVTQALVDKADASDLELQKITMTKEQIDALEVARYNEQIAILESEKAYLAGQEDREYEIELIEKQIEALGRLRDNAGKADTFRKAEETKQAFFDSMESQAHRVWSIFANEGGQSFKAIGQSLKAYVLDALYQLTLKKFFVNISAGIGATASGAALAEGNGVLGTTSWVDTITNGFKSVNTTFASSIENLGAFLSNGNGGLADQIGGFMGQYSSQIASGISYLGAATMLAQKNYASAALTAVGTYFGGPLGGMIGGAIGSMFGGKVKTKKSSAGATGSYIDGKFTGNGLTGLAGYGINAGGQDALTAGLEAYSKAFGSLLERFNLNSNITTNASVFQRNSKKQRGWGYFDAAFEGGSVNFATGHVGSAANAVGSIIDWILNTGMVESIQKSKLPEGVRMLFDGLADKAQVGNMITATMSLADAQEALLNRYNLTADSAGKVSIATGLAADDLAKFVTTLANTAFTSQKASEQLIQQRDKLNALLTDAGAGVGINANLTAFDDFLKSIDTQSAEGQKRFADLFSLRGSVGAMQTAWDELMGNVGASVYGLLSPAEQLKKDQEALNKLFSEYGLQVPKTADELAKLGQTIQQNFNAADEASIDLALAFPTLVAAFMGAKDKLIEGGREMSSFTSLADFRAYKGVLNNYGASIASDYAGVRGIVGNNVDGVTVLNDTQLDMLEVLKEMRKATEEARTASRETAEALRNIQVRGLKVAS